MSSQNRAVCFGITADDKRSAYWRVRSGTRRPELFIEREDHGAIWHLSLHESGQWHMKLRGEQRVHWVKPAEMVPGFTRAVGIVLPVTVIHKDIPALVDLRLVVVEMDSEPTAFNLFIERPGARLDIWPGKNAMKTMLIGRMPLAAGAGTVCIVANHEPIQPSNVNAPRHSDEELAWMRESAARGSLYMTVVGRMPDGGISLLEVRAEAQDVLASARLN